MLDAFAREQAQVAFAERHDAMETLLFDRPDEPFGVRVEIGTLRRQPDRLNPTAPQELGKDTSVQRDRGLESDGAPPAGNHPRGL